MTRLIYFIVFIIGLTIVMNISDYQGKPIDNAKFDFEKKAAANKEKAEEIHKLLHPEPVKKEEKVVVVEKPLVELTTPELENGSALYKKCIACHGKRGEGRKTQNAPAIGGQYDWYIATQITNMKSGERVNKIMNPYISRLSEQDIKDLASYISKLPYMGN